MIEAAKSTGSCEIMFGVEKMSIMVGQRRGHTSAGPWYTSMKLALGFFIGYYSIVVRHVASSVPK
jgi:hypothetical protein